MFLDKRTVVEGNQRDHDKTKLITLKSYTRLQIIPFELWMRRNESLQEPIVNNKSPGLFRI